MPTVPELASEKGEYSAFLFSFFFDVTGGVISSCAFVSIWLLRLCRSRCRQGNDRRFDPPRGLPSLARMRRVKPAFGCDGYHPYFVLCPPLPSLYIVAEERGVLVAPLSESCYWCFSFAN